MSLNVRPDPKRASGGYARLTGPIAGESVWVTVYNSFSERYLGQHDWQAAKVEFGPYQVETDNDQRFIVIGPEIVNHLVENSDVRFQIGSLGADVVWPDTISQRPGAAVIGGLRTLQGGSSAPPSPQLVTDLPEPTPETSIEFKSVREPVQPSVLLGTGETEAHLQETAATKPAKGSRFLPLILVLIFLAGVAGLAWYFFGQREPTDEPAPIAPLVSEPLAETPEVEDATTDPVANACSAEVLSALSATAFVDAVSTLGTCAGELSADRTLSIIENRASADDADALFAFGQLYDPSQTNSVIEETIGLTFSDNPALAAEYYSRAAAEGLEEAAGALVLTCERLGGRTDTLSESAKQEYCQ